MSGTFGDIGETFRAITETFRDIAPAEDDLDAEAAVRRPGQSEARK